jgi:hypothetical protein
MFNKKYGMHGGSIVNLWMQENINLIIHLISFFSPFIKHFNIKNLRNIQN